MNSWIKLVFLLFFGFNFSRLAAQDQHFQRTLHINGRLQFDYEFLKRDLDSDWFNANEFRRLQLDAAGKVAPHFKYKVEVSFAHGTLGFRDVYLKYSAGMWGNLAIGSMAEPTGLDMAESSKYSPFMERAMLTTLQNFRWGNGLHYENFSLYHSRMTLQAALTNNGNNGTGFKDPHLELGHNFSVRTTAAVFRNVKRHSLVHLGVNYAYRPYKDLKFRPENHMGDTYHYVFPDGKNRQTIGFEGVTNYQSFSLQSEYKILRVLNKARKDYRINSFYIMASYFLTGEYRPYKHGTFGRVNPEKDIENGGKGAFEILVRFSKMQFSDDVVSVNPDNPAMVDNWTFGLNWYCTAHIRLMYNYVWTNDGNRMRGYLNGHLIRVQMDF